MKSVRSSCSTQNEPNGGVAASFSLTSRELNVLPGCCCVFFHCSRRKKTKKELKWNPVHPVRGMQGYINAYFLLGTYFEFKFVWDFYFFAYSLIPHYLCYLDHDKASVVAL